MMETSVSACVEGRRETTSQAAFLERLGGTLSASCCESRNLGPAQETASAHNQIGQRHRFPPLEAQNKALCPAALHLRLVLDPWLKSSKEAQSYELPTWWQ